MAYLVLIVNYFLNLLHAYSNGDAPIRKRVAESRGQKELAGLRRFGETVEMCGKVKITQRLLRKWIPKKF
jgi:hypothetical protein